jgi:RNA polymerase sigma factor (sigma-70 family)
MNHDLAEPGTDSLLPTRRSLLSRLRNLQDQEGWREFFEMYWRLIYNVAREAGLTDVESQDVVQTTFIYLARRMPNFRYDRQRGAFKSWLRVVARSRINVYCRREKSDEKLAHKPLSFEAADDVESMEAVPDPAGDALDKVWQQEWEENLVNTAFRRLQSKVSSRQLLIFRMCLSGELALGQIAKKLSVNIASVYLIRHRVGKLFAAEVLRLREETE